MSQHEPVDLPIDQIPTRALPPPCPGFAARLYRPGTVLARWRAYTTPAPTSPEVIAARNEQRARQDTYAHLATMAEIPAVRRDTSGSFPVMPVKENTPPPAERPCVHVYLNQGDIVSWRVMCGLRHFMKQHPGMTYELHMSQVNWHLFAASLPHFIENTEERTRLFDLIRLDEDLPTDHITILGT